MQESVFYQSGGLAARITDGYIEQVSRILSFFPRLNDGAEVEPEKEDLAFLEQTEIIQTQLVFCENKERISWVPQVVWLQSSAIKNNLLAIGERIESRHWNTFQALKKPYVSAVLQETPRHLHKTQKFELQYLFFSDGWFILHCIKELVQSGRLQLPTQEQRKSLTTIVLPNR